MMRIKLPINQATLMQCSSDEFIEVSAQAGFTAVEFRMDRLQETLSHQPYKKLSHLIANHGLTVPAVNGLDGATFVPEDNLDLLKKECELVGRVCEMIEAPWVISPSALWRSADGPFPPAECLIAELLH